MAAKRKETKNVLTVGEASQYTGLTKRTLQYYDEIGLFHPTGRTFDGARYYAPADLVRLEQIVFYTDIGIPLETIRGLLEQQGELTEVNVLETQSMLLHTQIEHRQTQLAAIQAFLDVEKQGLKPSWLDLTRILQMEPDVDLDYWKDYQFDEGDKPSLEGVFGNIDQIWDFYYAWKRLIIRAAVYRASGVQPGDWLGRKLGADWRALVHPLLSRAEGVTETFERLRKGQKWLGEEFYLGIDAYIEAAAAA